MSLDSNRNPSIETQIGIRNLNIIPPEGVKSYLLVGSPHSIFLADISSKLEEGHYGQDWQEDEEPNQGSEDPHQGSHLGELWGISGEYVPRHVVPAKCNQSCLLETTLEILALNRLIFITDQTDWIFYQIKANKWMNKYWVSQSGKVKKKTEQVV